jgi:hypothetical protein
VIYRGARWAYELAEAVWMEHHPAATTPLLARGATPDSAVQEGRGRRVPLGGDAPGAMPTNGGNG